MVEDDDESNLCVARLVGIAEIKNSPAAKEAMRKEWDRLRSKYFWDESHPREWDGVRAEARRGRCTVHLGYLFGICVEKNSELAAHLRKFKGPRRVPREPSVQSQLQLSDLPITRQLTCDIACE